MSRPTLRKVLWGVGGVVLTLGPIGAVVVVAVMNQTLPNRVGTTRVKLGSLEQAVQQYYAQVGEYPSQAAGWSALMAPPYDLRPMLENPPLDEWQRPIRYFAPAGDADFELRSAGPDGEWHTEDDLSSNRREAPVAAITKDPRPSHQPGDTP